MAVDLQSFPFRIKCQLNWTQTQPKLYVYKQNKNHRKKSPTRSDTNSADLLTIKWMKVTWAKHLPQKAPPLKDHHKFLQKNATQKHHHKRHNHPHTKTPATTITPPQKARPQKTPPRWWQHQKKHHHKNTIRRKNTKTPNAVVGCVMWEWARWLLM